MSKQLNLFKIALLSGIKTGIFSISPLVMNFTIEPEERDLKEFVIPKNKNDIYKEMEDEEFE